LKRTFVSEALLQRSLSDFSHRVECIFLFSADKTKMSGIGYLESISGGAREDGIDRATFRSIARGGWRSEIDRSQDTETVLDQRLAIFAIFADRCDSRSPVAIVRGGRSACRRQQRGRETNVESLSGSTGIMVTVLLNFVNDRTTRRAARRSLVSPVSLKSRRDRSLLMLIA